MFKENMSSHYMKRDLYKILGVDRGASNSEIKKAYHRLALVHHPDKKGGSPERFQEIGAAFDILGNPDKRRKYDSGQLDDHGQERHPGGVSNSEFDPFDVFSSFFGNTGFSRESYVPRKQQKKMTLSVALEDLYRGREITLKITRKGLCVECNGNGGIGPRVRCKDCNGAGRVRRMVQLGPGMIQQGITMCDRCSGYGSFHATRCSMCHGARRCEETSEVTIAIEKGTQDRDSIVLDGLGDWNIDARDYDDIVLVVETPQHARLKRVGNDLHLAHHTSLFEALTGCSFNYRHLNGKDYTISTDCVVDPEFRYIVPGMGMPSKKSSAYGNLIISFNIAYPTHIVKDVAALEHAFGQKRPEVSQQFHKVVASRLR